MVALGRRHWQWHMLCWFFGGDLSRAVFSLVCTPVMFVIMVGLDQKDSYALFPVVACTAPVAELNVVLFTVPSNYCTIAATATVVTSCSSSSVCGGVCVTMSCGGGFVSPGGFYDSVWDSVRPMIGNTPAIPFSTLDVECVCMLNDWIICMTIFAPTTTTIAGSC